MKPIDLIGQRFGRLLVLRRSGTAKNRHATWECRCDCGATTVTSGSNLRSGVSTSCGCYHREQQAKRVTERNAREVVSYVGAHDRVQRVRGKASLYVCIDCGCPAAEWSYSHHDPDEILGRSGPFSLDPRFYEPRCRSCHKTFDMRNRADHIGVVFRDLEDVPVRAGLL